ncbi:MAG: cobalt-precorrin-5B (C(1))-methyltransferase CbiD [Ruminococcus sp.]
MKPLREGYTTGSCAAAASLASALWQVTGICPEQVELETPAGVTLRLEIQEVSQGVCGVIKDGGDDPDETNGCLVTAKVEISDKPGEIRFYAGEGVGIITRKGLKLPVGEPAINPVPRQMIEKALRSVIGQRGAAVTISVPGGAEIAVKTFNGRLGIQGGLSILGTTGIVRPMSEEAVKESLCLELSMCRAEYGTACALVTGYAGEKYLRKQYDPCGGIVLCSNYLGYLLDCAEEMGFTHILLAGRPGKLVKPAADIMYLHSHTAGGQREVLCTHAALAGTSTDQVRQLYQCNTTSQMQELLSAFGLGETVWASVAESACENCMRRTHGKIQVGMMLLDEKDQILAKSQLAETVRKEWSQCSMN